MCVYVHIQAYVHETMRHQYKFQWITVDINRPFCQGLQTSHAAERQVEIVRFLLLFLLVGLQSLIPFMQFLIPAFLDFLQIKFKLINTFFPNINLYVKLDVRGNHSIKLETANIQVFHISNVFSAFRKYYFFPNHVHHTCKSAHKMYSTVGSFNHILIEKSAS